MSTPDEIRANIEATRGDLGTDVDALADKVSPSAIAHRQTERVRNRFASVRDSVMGAAESAADKAQSGSSNAGGAAQDVAHRAVGKARGNPLAVGLIAFGAGWLAASLVPSTPQEEQLAGTAKDKAAPLVDELKESAKSVGADLKDSATEHAQDLKDTAQDAAQAVKNDAQSAASDVQQSAQGARDDVQNA